MIFVFLQKNMARTPSNMLPLGTKSPSFELLDTVSGLTLSLDQIHGKEGTVVMFICNHCPYVLAILDKLVVETDVLQTKGIGVVAVNPNDNPSYPDDSFGNMVIISKKYGFGFPYLIDETQQIAKNYGAVCTPDFYGYNSSRELQYRGRLEESKASKVTKSYIRQLVKEEIRKGKK